MYVGVVDTQIDNEAVRSSSDPGDHQHSSAGSFSIPTTVANTTLIIIVVQIILFAFLFWRFRVMQVAFMAKLQSLSTNNSSMSTVDSTVKATSAQSDVATGQVIMTDVIVN